MVVKGVPVATGNLWQDEGEGRLLGLITKSLVGGVRFIAGCLEVPISHPWVVLQSLTQLIYQ